MRKKGGAAAAPTLLFIRVPLIRGSKMVNGELGNAAAAHTYRIKSNGELQARREAQRNAVACKPCWAALPVTRKYQNQSFVGVPLAFIFARFLSRQETLERSRC